MNKYKIEHAKVEDKEWFFIYENNILLTSKDNLDEAKEIIKWAKENEPKETVIHKDDYKTVTLHERGKNQFFTVKGSGLNEYIPIHSYGYQYNKYDDALTIALKYQLPKIQILKTIEL